MTGSSHPSNLLLFSGRRARGLDSPTAERANAGQGDWPSPIGTIAVTPILRVVVAENPRVTPTSEFALVGLEAHPRAVPPADAVAALAAGAPTAEVETFGGSFLEKEPLRKERGHEAEVVVEVWLTAGLPRLRGIAPQPR